MKKEGLIGRSIVGFRFESSLKVDFTPQVELQVGNIGEVKEYDIKTDSYGVTFDTGSHWYPGDIIENYLVAESQTSNNFFSISNLNEKLNQELTLENERNKITIDESISMLENAISRMMNFESTSDKNDFLLDVVNEYKNELANPTKRSEEFADLVKPLIKYLNDKQDPHTKIIIDCTSAEMVKGEMSYHTNEFLND